MINLHFKYILPELCTGTSGVRFTILHNEIGNSLLLAKKHHRTLETGKPPVGKPGEKIFYGRFLDNFIQCQIHSRRPHRMIELAGRARYFVRRLHMSQKHFSSVIHLIGIDCTNIAIAESISAKIPPGVPATPEDLAPSQLTRGLFQRA